MDIDDGEEGGDYIKYQFKVKLVTPFGARPTHFSDDSVLSHLVSPGIVLGYNDELAKYDKTTVPSIIRQYFLGALGDDEEDAMENYEDLKSAWGNLHKSDWGNRMSHLFKAIEIALETQTVVLPIVVKGNYAGCVLQGAGWVLKVGGAVYSPFSLDEVRQGVAKVDGHSNALWKIFSKMTFQTPEDRQVQYAACKGTKDLYRLTSTLGVGSAENQAAVLKLAEFLSFDNERPLPSTAHNIDLVLGYVADPLKDILTLPYIHTSMLFEVNRRHLAWSAFGDSAPSFRVPSGRKMPLGASFEVALPKKGGNQVEKRSVRKIGCNMVPLELALRHLDDVFEDKQIWNPFGNAVVGASFNNLYKVYEGDSVTTLLAAFRRAMSINITAGPGVGKRGNDDDQGGDRKKRRAKISAF